MFVQDSAPLPIPVTLARDRLLAYLHDDARLQPDTGTPPNRARRSFGAPELPVMPPG